MTNTENTLTTIAWKRTPYPGGFVVYTGDRGGWCFRIDLTKSGTATLLATRAGLLTTTTRCDNLKAAKAAAFAMLRPSEAMAWRSGTPYNRPGYEARWGGFHFLAGLVGEARYKSLVSVDGGSFLPLTQVGTLNEARAAARRVLDAHYSQAPEVVPAEELSAALQDGLGKRVPAAAIEAALKAAGLCLTVREG